MRKVQIQGHRGARGEYPENTIAGIEHTLELGVDGIEVDIVLSKDKKAFLFHDQYLNKQLWPQRISFSELTSDEVSKIDCGSLFNKNFPHQKRLVQYIPRLEDILELFSKTNTQTFLNLEFKYFSQEISPQHYLEVIEKALEQYSELHQNIMLHSFSSELLKHRKDFDILKKLPTGLLVEESIDEKRCLELKDELQLTYLSPESCLLKTQEQVNIFKKQALKILTWTVNDEKEWDRMVHLGVDGIITDFPSKFLKRSFK